MRYYFLSKAPKWYIKCDNRTGQECPHGKLHVRKNVTNNSHNQTILEASQILRTTQQFICNKESPKAQGILHKNYLVAKTKYKTENFFVLTSFFIEFWQPNRADTYNKQIFQRKSQTQMIPEYQKEL
jgi:hypothetical protein